MGDCISSYSLNTNDNQERRPLPPNPHGNRHGQHNNHNNNNAHHRRPSDNRQRNPEHVPSPRGLRQDEDMRQQGPRRQSNDNRQRNPEQNYSPQGLRQDEDMHRQSRGAPFRIPDTTRSPPQGRQYNDMNKDIEQDIFNALARGDNFNPIIKGVPIDKLVEKSKQPPRLIEMNQIRDENHTFLIKPFKQTAHRPPEPTVAGGNRGRVVSFWDDNHVHMPYAQSNRTHDNKSIWEFTLKCIANLKAKCDNGSASFHNLQATIQSVSGVNYDLTSLGTLIENLYNRNERHTFMTTTLSKICELVLTLESTCPEAPPVLRCQSNKSVTLSQHQAAALLACSFFCIFPNRSDKNAIRAFERFPNPNFNRLYERGSAEKMEKLKCIFNYFRRISLKMPNGVISFRRFALRHQDGPLWNDSNTNLVDLSLLNGKKIEDIPNALQVDFANKYIGGGVLGNGCVQEEIRFSICPEMLVSLLVCEVMEDNECVFLIGCERFSNYRGYANSFEFDSDYVDNTPSDNWGRKWCHLVAIDAIFFRDKTAQYQMNKVERELFKAYAGFRPIDDNPDSRFAIATGNWGCGAFNGDRQLKAIIQWMAASEAQRPLIYAAFGDRKLIEAFDAVQQYLKNERATVGDLYWYIHKYSRLYKQCSLFDLILQTSVKELRRKH